MTAPSDAGFRRSLADCLAGFGVLLFALVMEVAGVVFASSFGPGLALLGLLAAIAGAAILAVAVHEMGLSTNPRAP